VIEFRSELKRIRLPSGDHPETTSRPGWYMSRCASPPDAGIIYIGVPFMAGIEREPGSVGRITRITFHSGVLSQPPREMARAIRRPDIPSVDERDRVRADGGALQPQSFRRFRRRQCKRWQEGPYQRDQSHPSRCGAGRQDRLNHEAVGSDVKKSSSIRATFCWPSSDGCMPSSDLKSLGFQISPSALRGTMPSAQR